ncbi:hypothetical protein [Streptomyces griseoviridis]|uniref:Prenyltransferase n=1 Tax=Streptomyces griseoviridis TaxID=45398 RepID=A0ABT9LLP5_STRGD|nr:hypothetical protein [Streptomyces griseoviridis]MDP9684463.1 hypothetical protein [Streptomyces griseoviridis]GGT05734.1 hypothetical protein GCM10010240_43890 [Streptomyces griseoviridis]
MAETGVHPLPPMPTARSPLARAEQFVRLTARVLDQHLFAYHFRDGDPAPVQTALDAYRNPDGGYGHALEPLLRGPDSQVPHTARALRVLDAVGRCDGPRIEHTCRYLASVSAPDGALPASARPAPGTPGALTATGPVVGLLHRNRVWHAWLFRATEFCWRLSESPRSIDPYEIQAAVAFLDSAPDRPRAEATADRLGRLLREHRLAVLDPDDRDTAPPVPGERRRLLPHEYARVPGSCARAWFTDAEMARSLDVLAAAQEEDGGWPAPCAGPPSVVLESRPAAAISALRTLRAYGRPIG